MVNTIWEILISIKIRNKKMSAEIGNYNVHQVLGKVQVLPHEALSSAVLMCVECLSLCVCAWAT